ncbi:VWA domain-containing protein [Thalassiella azotivora]
MDDLRLALLLAAVSPSVGGVLVRGEKGTAKTTAVRGLTALLPAVDVVAGCRFSCDPAHPDPGCPDGPHDEPAAVTRRARLVELPVGAAEDRLLGSLHLERALTEGVTAYEPGLLAQSHRGVLYVDEVNLLHDHLVDVLLDAAATGRAVVERDQVSVEHAARFLLVGTMNPEEGELRPQLLDRFGLTVEVAASREPRTRAEVVRRGLAFETDPAGFCERWAAEQADLAARVRAARALLPDVVLGDEVLEQVAHVCAAFDVDGMRADLVTARAARAHAAWNGRREVTVADVRAAARFTLPHRRRRTPFDAPGLDEDRLDEVLPDDAQGAGPDDAGDDTGPDHDGPQDGGGPGGPDGGPDGGPGWPDDGPGGDDGADGGASLAPPVHGDLRDGSDGDGTTGDSGQPSHATDPEPPARAPAPAPRRRTDEPQPFRARTLTVEGVGRGAAGRRSRATGTSTGRVVRHRRLRAGERTAPDLVGTLRAAAPHQAARCRRPGGPTGRVVLSRDDLRVAVREGREGNLVLFCVDASGSMAARRRTREVASAVLSLLADAYQRRDTVGLVTFRGTGAQLIVPPTSSVDVAARRLEDLATGGRTPLAEGLDEALGTVLTRRRREPDRRALVVVVTDGRATSGRDALVRSHEAAARLRAADVACVVVDCEAAGGLRLGLARELAVHLGAEHLPLGEVAADALTATVRDRTRDARTGVA